MSDRMRITITFTPDELGNAQTALENYCDELKDRVRRGSDEADVLASARRALHKVASAAYQELAR
jgi:methyl-accepting chemotaxis protein